MHFDMAAYGEMRRKFLANRAAFPAGDLVKYAGSWVAWSPDGSRIVAAAERPDLLDAIVQAAGEDPAHCVVEGIPAEDSLIGEVDGSAA
jgi:hypothetical protein